jgi:hypothetical protein
LQDEQLFVPQQKYQILTSNTTTVPQEPFNQNGTCFQSTLDLMLDARAKSESRKRKYDEMHFIVQTRKNPSPSRDA